MNKLFLNARYFPLAAALLPRGSARVAGVLSQNLHVSGTRQDIFNIQDKEDFKERVLNSDKPVLIDFHAKWANQQTLEKSFAFNGFIGLMVYLLQGFFG